MLTEMSKNWWLFLVRGLLAVAVGVLALIWPAPAWLALVTLFGAFVLLDGVFTLVAGIDFIQYFDRGWAVMLEGVMGIIIGILTLIWTKPASEILFYFVAAWAVFTGILEILTAARIRFFIPGEWAMILAGVLSILCGILLFVFPASGVVALVWTIGIYAIGFGITQMVFATHLHSLESDIKQSGLAGI
jgi:uncharacterized membrane protein HdeD (DUF308 family)